MSKPVIICLHGRGANAEIFEIQSMPFIRLLEPRFECIFVDAPNECEAGPNILPIFEDEAPFYSWLGSGSSSTSASNLEAIEETIYLLNELEESTPNIAGIIGFSQGAAVGLGLLLRDQRRRSIGLPYVGYKFGVFAGEVRLPVLFEQDYPNSGTSTPSFDSDHSRPALGLSTPTIHATGRMDALAAKGTTLSKSDIGRRATVFTYDGGHEMPQKPNDAQYVAQWVHSQYTKC
ncbi:citrinin biosynthesis oxydoreductase CtnB [Cordyceps fumosorosea ARSEF 2679]|uniref:Citrinin biosynthesis oxydoreductase CtnB n=1 Tax=Cordyceps fumosorosea (strain ARSEF 2679) TaxID=1081104 RepID=A0A167Q632_CORFA|nr:citrinin biosynthesis oxydoreductase CtnB [Cordyceps fumosorosea ARSEF 2679]OAA57330.1 citrinin biosynthesis oxydoreductase CtnB [Cordyceps fumosorosea ARSEF 2679]